MNDVERMKRFLEIAIQEWKDMGYQGRLYCRGQLVMGTSLLGISLASEEYKEMDAMIEEAFK